MDFIQSEQALQFNLPPKSPFSLPPVCISDQMGAKDKSVVFEGKLPENIASPSAAPFISPTSGANYTDKSSPVPEKDSSPSIPMEKMIQKVSSSAGPWSKALLQKVEEVKKSQKVHVDLIFSDEELRRSRRVTSHNKGFRNSGCNDKNCIGCSANPPHLSQEVIRNLGEAFCKVDSS